MSWHEFIDSQKMNFTVYLGYMIMVGSLFTVIFSSVISLQIGYLSLSLLALVGGLSLKTYG